MTRSEPYKSSPDTSSSETEVEEEVKGSNPKDRKIHPQTLKLTTAEAQKFIFLHLEHHVQVTISKAIQSAVEQMKTQMAQAQTVAQVEASSRNKEKEAGGRSTERPDSSSSVETSEIDANSCPSAREPLALTLITVQISLIVLFAFMVQYDGVEEKVELEKAGNKSDDAMNHCNLSLQPHPQPNMVSKYYQQYQDIQVMIFLGIGLLMAFIHKYGYSAIGFCLLIGTLSVEWSILVRGIIYNGSAPIKLNLISLIYGDFAAAVVLISFGVVIGVASPLQLIFMTFSEICFYILNEYIGAFLFGAVDTGGSIFVHIFAAYFGLGVSRGMRSASKIDTSDLTPSYNSNIFCLVSVVFLWLFWPSFNSVLSTGSDQDRVVINTILSLFGSAVAAFATSAAFNRNQFNLAHIQNASLAGGVAVGAVVDLLIRPFGAMIIGGLGGFLCVVGCQFVSPLLTKFGLHDSCGVHNLHGLPGVLAAFGSVVMAAIATECEYGPNLYLRYPARAPGPEFPERLGQLQALEPGILPGLNRTGMEQAMVQLTALGITFAISLVGGAVTGLVMRLPIFRQIEANQCFDDAVYFQMDGTDGDEQKIKKIKVRNNGQTNKVNPVPEPLEFATQGKVPRRKLPYEL